MNFFFICTSPAPPPRPNKFSNSPSLSVPSFGSLPLQPQKPVMKDIIHRGMRIKACFVYRFSHDRGIYLKKERKRKKRKEKNGRKDEKKT